jgi:hypothetical protein
MSAAKVKQFFVPVRSADVINMTREAAEARLRTIHERLSDRGGPLGFTERTRLEQERLALVRALESQRKTAGVENQGSAPAVEVRSTPCGGRATRTHVMKRDSRGRPMVIHEHRFGPRRPLSAEQVLAEVEERIVREIKQEVAGLEPRVAANQARIDQLGPAPTLAANRGAPPGFAPMVFAHEAPSEADGR